MTRLVALRLLVATAPVLIACLLVAPRSKSPSLLAALILSVSWNAWTLFAINIAALHFGWWSFHPAAPDFMGVAVEPWLGWMVLWGAVPLIAADRPAAVGVLVVAWADVVAMPMLEPLVELGPGWLVGDAVAVAVAFVPGLLAFRWTIQGMHLTQRLAMQVVCAGGLMVLLTGSIAVHTAGGWRTLFELPAWQLALAAQVALLAAILGLRAAMEFADRGRGTPLPYDPPKRLVTSGPYAYVRNPMQLSMVLVYSTAGIVLENLWLVAAAAIAFAYGTGLAQWHEDVQLGSRFGDEWRAYRMRVRTWIPTLRPATAPPATLYVAYSCGTCSSIGRWFVARDPIGLTISPAEEANDPDLRRVTYAPVQGEPERGVAAIARALEHIHIGWAVVGWVLAMPGIVHFAQLLADVFGPAPHPVAGLPYDRTACAVNPLQSTPPKELRAR